MATLFEVTFEDQKFLPDIEYLGSYVMCSGGTIEISAGSALVGSYGMAVTPRTSASTSNYSNIAILSRYIEPQTRYRQRFYFDPNAISMSASKEFIISQGGNYADPKFKVILYYSSGYYIVIRCYNDAGASSTSSAYSITDDVHYIETDWKASSGVGMNDGYFDLWIDGVKKGSSPTLSGIDNDTKFVSQPSIGCCSGHSPTLSGVSYFDNWEANNDGSAIGA